MDESPSAALRVRGLQMQRGPHTLFRDLCFQLDFGHVLAVLGPNGVGKSTLLRGLVGLLPFRGEVDVQGVALRLLRPKQRARRLAYVPQRPALQSSLPVHEVVAHGRYAHGSALRRRGAGEARAVHEAMAAADLLHLAERPFTALSQGEQQRVLLARGLCTGAGILCLDEPTAALDVGHALALHGMLRTLAGQGYAVLIVLHDLAHALRFADRALLISPGAPARLGPVSEVVSPAAVHDVYGVSMHTRTGVEFELPAGLGGP